MQEHNEELQRENASLKTRLRQLESRFEISEGYASSDSTASDVSPDVSPSHRRIAKLRQSFEMQHAVDAVDTPCHPTTEQKLARVSA